MRGVFSSTPPEGCDSVTYMEYLNLFNQWLEDDNPTDKAIVLYYGLLNTFNRRRWPRWAGVDTQRLMLLARTTDRKAAFRARDILVKAGFLEYKSGRKGVATEYRLLQYGGKYPTENDTENTTENATGNDTENATPIKTKKKTKKKTPPIPPTGGQEGGDFLRFWQEYPRKMGRENARRAWEKLAPDQHLTGVILSAVERDKDTDQWQRENGRYIPYPATWLNQRRWEDQPEVVQPEEPPRSYDIDQLAELAVLDLPDEL